jgi:threonine/homoserine/homoserine lactone efflux protein
MMTNFAFWWRGALLGFAIAAPVGPIGLLCIQRTLNRGNWHGLVSGLGAATADAFYGCVAALGLTLVSTFLTNQRVALALIGGLFLCYLGVRTFLTPPATQAANLAQRGLWSSYGSTLFLTLTNPLTIFAFFGIFAALKLVNNGSDYGATLALVAGVFCGSAAWWLLLSTMVALLRQRFNATALQWVNRIAGVIVVGFGLVTLLGLLRGK